MKKFLANFWPWLPMPIFLLVLAILSLGFNLNNTNFNQANPATNPAVRAIPINQPTSLILRNNHFKVQVTLEHGTKVQKLAAQLPRTIHYKNMSARVAKHAIINNEINHGTIAYNSATPELIFNWSSKNKIAHSQIIGHFKYATDLHQVERWPYSGIVTVKEVR
ncbi:hypothetical protein RXV91_06505 [Lactiplantibacillus sp. DA1]|uniref:hypothetical protein n=1 Tax=Lactiplantibacillus sp. DA1 TaxID=3079857 RepID=UPI00292A62BD|nr:hypothetical protein [Lactiplantibacillus sp. DA1]MDV0430526.1 hypothetical protein [Lactiplantibacillus sp. DA1]